LASSYDRRDMTDLSGFISSRFGFLENLVRDESSTVLDSVVFM